MKDQSAKSKNEITEHLFRLEYGKIVAVIVKFIGINHLKLAEDITQEAFYKAVKHWQHNGIPPNPKAWLYITAKNECRNILKKLNREKEYENILLKADYRKIEEIDFSESVISDGQLKMMFICCNPCISKESQQALILKILCGFSISEIANAFITSKETINKRLVRARKKMKENMASFQLSKNFEREVPTIIEAIYILFNEGYSPTEKNRLIRKDLCLEAIRLLEIIKDNSKIKNKEDCYSLLSLMYLNASRFEARMDESNEAIEMKDQDRSQWNKQLIERGIIYLDKATANNSLSIYLILAAISANHCVAADYTDTNWKEILNLYNSMLTFTDTPLIRLNRSVALSKVKGNSTAINELKQLKNESDIEENHLFHSTIAEFYFEELNFIKAEKHLKEALLQAKNTRDRKILRKKLSKVVPI